MTFFFVLSAAKNNLAASRLSAGHERKKERNKTDRCPSGSCVLFDSFRFSAKKERKKTDNPREGWEDGTPPEQAHIASREGGALLLTPHARGGPTPPRGFTTC